MSHPAGFATLQCQHLGTSVSHRVGSTTPVPPIAHPEMGTGASSGPSSDPPSLPQLLQEMEQENLLLLRAAWERSASFRVGAVTCVSACLDPGQQEQTLAMRLPRRREAETGGKRGCLSKAGRETACQQGFSAKRRAPSLRNNRTNIGRRKKIMQVSKAGIFNLLCFADLQKYPTRDASSFVANRHHLARRLLASVALP